MTNKQVAIEYLNSFCNADIEALQALLAENLIFNGTFHSFNSAEDYLESLRKDPPEKCDYKILSITENDDSVAVFYEYIKLDRTIKIAQLFKIHNQKIDQILLIFDGRSSTH